MKFNPNVTFTVWRKVETYTAGAGAATTWELVTSATGSGTAASEHFCEWKGAYGVRLLTAESLGVNDLATLRTPYNPEVLDALTKYMCVIVKNADSAAVVDGVPDFRNVNTYQLYAGANNALESNQFMEFRVRRYQGK